MTEESLMTRIEGLDPVKIGTRDDLEVRKLKDLYMTVFKENVSSGCDGCVMKAYGKLRLLTIKRVKEMNELKFKLKEGVLLPYGEFGSGEHLSQDTLTNKKAYEVLTKHPSLLDFFEDYPRNDDGSFKEAEPLDILEAESTAESVFVPITPTAPATGDDNAGQEQDITDVDDENKTIHTDLDGVVLEAPKKKDLSKTKREVLEAEYLEKFNTPAPAELNKAQIYELLIKA